MLQLLFICFKCETENILRKVNQKFYYKKNFWEIHFIFFKDGKVIWKVNVNGMSVVEPTVMTDALSIYFPTKACKQLVLGENRIWFEHIFTDKVLHHILGRFRRNSLQFFV